MKTIDNMPIVIKAPTQGLGASAVTGFGNVVNIDVDSVPGVAKISNKTAPISGTSITTQIKWIVNDPLNTDNAYALSADGKVWKYVISSVTFSQVSGSSATNAHGNGLWIWNDYLFVARDVYLDTYGPLSGTAFTANAGTDLLTTSAAHGLVDTDKIIFTGSDLPDPLVAGTVYYVIAEGLTATDFEFSTSSGGSKVNITDAGSGTMTYVAWKIDWKAINSDVDWHPMLTSKNDSKMYGGAGLYVYSLEEVVGQTFTPGVTGTRTWTQQALELPEAYRIKAIEELGGNLLLGTWKGTTITGLRSADIFVWDRSSASYGQPIVLNEFGIHGLKTIGDYTFILAGVDGNIWKTNGASATRVAKIPYELNGNEYFEFFPGAICSFKNRIFFGLGNAGDEGYIGIFSLKETGDGNVLVLEHINSLGTDGTADIVQASAICPISRNTFLSGIRSANTYKLELSSNSAFYTSYGAYFESPLYQIGDALRPFKFASIEFQLAKPLASGEGIKLEYKRYLGDTATEIKTFAYATSADAVTSKNFTTMLPNDIKAGDQIIFRISLTGSSSTPYLKSITII